MIYNIAEEFGTAVRGGEQRVRLGVTGLSRAGKTVFITSLIANLLERDRMPLLSAEAEGRIITAQLAEQPSATIARFEFEEHLAKLLSDTPSWPESTRQVSEIRLSFRLERQGLKTAVFGSSKMVHVDIVDYPGEWLLDLGLIDKSYEAWSAEILRRFEMGSEFGEQEFLAKINMLGNDTNLSAQEMVEIASRFTDVARARHASGLSDTIPGRFLLPSELEGAPAITFTPLPESAKSSPSYRLFARRFASYKKEVVRPFFRNHFAKLDRQIVLVDVLSAMEGGGTKLQALEEAMADILSAFRPGRNGFLEMVIGRKIDKIAFVATKADLLHHSQHDGLVAMTRAILKKAERRALYNGAKTSAKAVAALRCTVEDEAVHDGEKLPIVRGRRASDGKKVGFHFGEMPKDAEGYLLNPREGDFSAPRLLPPNLGERGKAGLPHMRMDQLAEFLLGDKLR